MSDVYLSQARYGKDLVRVLRVVRDEATKEHRIAEYNVTVLLEGNIETSYTQADNSVVVATDSMKNITYYLSKVSPHILIPERFALHLASHILSKYNHITKVFIKVEQLRWSRIQGTNGHSFTRDGDDKRVIEAELSKEGDKFVGQVSSGIKDLLVLKSTGSTFENFVRDEYTTLKEVNDRIFSTSVDLAYTFDPITLPVSGDLVVPEKIQDGSVWDPSVADRARAATLETFATDESASVQATLYKMAERILKENKGVKSVKYALPNKHYIPVDLSYIGLENVQPDKAEVFAPIAAPSGLITATISRKE